jgi:hypothetical protein
MKTEVYWLRENKFLGEYKKFYDLDQLHDWADDNNIEDYDIEYDWE